MVLTCKCLLTVQAAITLTSGALSASGSGALTYGIGSGTLTMTRTVGTMTFFLLHFQELTGGTLLNVAYGSGATLSTSTGNEIPDAATALINTFTLNTNTTGTLTLTKSIIVNSTWTNTTGILSIGANTLTLNGAVTMTAGSFIGGSSSDIVFGGSGVAALVMNNGTLGTQMYFIILL